MKGFCGKRDIFRVYSIEYGSGFVANVFCRSVIEVVSWYLQNPRQSYNTYTSDCTLHYNDGKS